MFDNLQFFVSVQLEFTNGNAFGLIMFNKLNKAFVGPTVDLLSVRDVSRPENISVPFVFV